MSPTPAPTPEPALTRPADQVDPVDPAQDDLARAEMALAEAAADGKARPGEALVRLLLHSGRRLAIVVGGFGLCALGVVLIPLPGPGALIILAGLALLAKEFVWAERLLARARAAASQGAGAAKRLARRRSG